MVLRCVPLSTGVIRHVVAPGVSSVLLLTYIKHLSCVVTVFTCRVMVPFRPLVRRSMCKCGLRLVKVLSMVVAPLPELLPTVTILTPGQRRVSVVRTALVVPLFLPQ